MSDLISRSALMRKLGIKDDCSDCQYKDGVYCQKGGEFVNACEAIADAPIIETISTDCVNVNKVIEEALEIWKANDGDTAMQTLIDWLKEYCPRVIAVPIKHGHWIKENKVYPELPNDGDYYWYCSECRSQDQHNINVEVPFCWHCGAKMDEVEEWQGE